MLYALDASDVVRLRKLLIAYEQGRLQADRPPDVMPSQAGRQDTILGHVTTAIPSGTTGTAVMVKVDRTTTPPTLTDLTNTDKVYTVLNEGDVLQPGYYLLAREPTSGVYIPADVADNPLVGCMTNTGPTGGTVHPQFISWSSLSVWAYPAVVVSNLSSGYIQQGAWVPVPNSTQNQNAWLIFNSLGGQPLLNAQYPVLPAAPGAPAGLAGTGTFNGLPVYETDFQAPFVEATTPVTFTDHPNKSVVIVAPEIEDALNTFVGMSGILFGTGFLSLGGILPSGLGSGGAPVGCIDLYIGAGYAGAGTGTVYKGATGTDGIGNVFASGVCITIGGGGGTSDDGSYWP